MRKPGTDHVFGSPRALATKCRASRSARVGYLPASSGPSRCWTWKGTVSVRFRCQARPVLEGSLTRTAGSWRAWEKVLSRACPRAETSLDLDSGVVEEAGSLKKRA